MAGNSHSFYGDLRDENVIYRLGGFNGNAAKGLVYKHSHIISAQIGIKTAQKAMEKGFDQLLTKAKAELNSQIKWLQKEEKALAKKGGPSIEQVLAKIQSNDDISALCQSILDLKKATLGQKKISMADSLSDSTKANIKRQMALSSAEFADNFLKNKQFQTEIKNATTRIGKAVTDRKAGSFKKGDRRIKQSSITDVQSALGTIFEAAAAVTQLEIKLENGWKLCIYNTSEELQGGGDKYNKADTLMVIIDNTGKEVFSFTTTDKTSGIVDISDLKDEADDWLGAVKFIPTWHANLNAALVEDDAGRIRPFDDETENARFRAASRYIAYNASSSEEFNEARNLVAAAVIWSGIIVQITGWNNKNMTGYKLPMFVRHLNGFYKTSDMLKLLQAESNRNNGLGIVSEDFVDMARFTWMQPLNEYAPRTPEAIEELKKKIKSAKKKDKIQGELDAWENLWFEKYEYLLRLPPGVVATYLEIYSDKRVQQALSKLDAYYRPRINFSVALQIKLNNLKPIGA